MTCTNFSTNLEIKKATNDILTNIYKYTSNNIYEPNNISSFGSNFKEMYTNINTDLDKFENNEGKENLVTVDEDNIYINCVYQTSLPWFTTSENKKKCEVIPNIKLPEDRLILDSKTSIITPIFKSADSNKPGFCSYYSNVNKAYCENTWYDWIITPNYYLGNTYYKDNSHYTDVDVYKCYAPCEGDYMPYTKKNGELKCIPKKYFSNGIFNNKYIFSAFGLINLIGNIALSNDEKNNKSTNLLYLLHKIIIEYNIENNYDKNLYEINDELKTQFIDNTNITNKYTDLYTNLKDSINKNIFFKFSNSNNQDYSIINEFTYKHRKFNESEPEMYSFNGLDVCNVLIDPILIHTWIIANLFQPLNEDILTYTNLNDIITTDVNYTKVKNSLLYNKLYDIFKNHDKVIRLKNIFFKAVNICYNYKTNFSINIVEKTKEAFNNKKIINNIIIENKFYNFTDNIFYLNYLLKANPGSSDVTYPFSNNPTDYNMDYYKKCIEYILHQDRLTEFKEHTLYKDIDIKVFGKKYNDILTTSPNNFYKFLFKKADEDNNDDTLWNYKYYYSMERLEKPTCDKGYEWNSKYKVCDPIKQTENINKEDKEVEEDEFQIPELKKILYLFMQIIVIIIILYILYIFYDIFGEVIISLYNRIVMYIIKLQYYIEDHLPSGDGEYEKEIKILENKKKYIETKYKNIENKDIKIEEYLRTHS